MLFDSLLWCRHAYELYVEHSACPSFKKYDRHCVIVCVFLFSLLVYALATSFIYMLVRPDHICLASCSHVGYHPCAMTACNRG